MVLGLFIAIETPYFHECISPYVNGRAAGGVDHVGESISQSATLQLRLKSPASRMSFPPIIRAQIKKNTKVPRHWPLRGDSTGEWWIPLTKGQQHGKCFHLMTSKWSIQYRKHAQDTIGVNTRSLSMYLSHIPQCTNENKNVHISVLNGAFWDMGQVHWEIYEFDLSSQYCIDSYKQPTFCRQRLHI